MVNISRGALFPLLSLLLLFLKLLIPPLQGRTSCHVEACKECLLLQVLRDAFDYADSELSSTAMDLSRSGATAVVSIVTSEW